MRWGKIHDNDVGVMAAKKLIACGYIASFENTRDACILQQAATCPQHDRVIVYNEDTGHVF